MSWNKKASSLLNSVMAAFRDEAQAVHNPQGGGSSSTVNVIYTERNKTVPVGNGLPTSINELTVTVRLVDFAVAPLGDDNLVFGGKTYLISDVREDGIGGADIDLNLVE